MEANTTQASKEKLRQNNQQKEVLEAQVNNKTECKVCKNSYKSILKHLGQQPDCMILYSESEITALKKWSEQVSALKQKVWEEKNKEKRSLKNQAYHQVHKKAISKSKSEYYSKNKDVIAIKKKKRETETKDRKAKETREENQKVIEDQIKWRDDYEKKIRAYNLKESRYFEQTRIPEIERLKNLAHAHRRQYLTCQELDELAKKYTEFFNETQQGIEEGAQKARKVEPEQLTAIYRHSVSGGLKGPFGFQAKTYIFEKSVKECFPFILEEGSRSEKWVQLIGRIDFELREISISLNVKMTPLAFFECFERVDPVNISQHSKRGLIDLVDKKHDLTKMINQYRSEVEDLFEAKMKQHKLAIYKHECLTQEYKKHNTDPKGMDDKVKSLVTGLTNVMNQTYDELSADIKNFFKKSIVKFGDGAGNFSNHILNKYMFRYTEHEMSDFLVYTKIRLGTLEDLINDSIKDQDEEMMPNDHLNF